MPKDTITLKNMKLVNLKSGWDLLIRPGVTIPNPNGNKYFLFDQVVNACSVLTEDCSILTEVHDIFDDEPINLDNHDGVNKLARWYRDATNINALYRYMIVNTRVKGALVISSWKGERESHKGLNSVDISRVRYIHRNYPIQVPFDTQNYSTIDLLHQIKTNCILNKGVKLEQAGIAQIILPDSIYDRQFWYPKKQSHGYRLSNEYRKLASSSFKYPRFFMRNEVALLDRKKLVTYALRQQIDSHHDHIHLSVNKGEYYGVV